MRVGEGMRTFGAMKYMWSCRNISLNVKELYERIVVLTLMYGSETWGMGREEKKVGRI